MIGAEYHSIRRPMAPHKFEFKVRKKDNRGFDISGPAIAQLVERAGQVSNAFSQTSLEISRRRTYHLPLVIKSCCGSISPVRMAPKASFLPGRRSRTTQRTTPVQGPRPAPRTKPVALALCGFDFGAKYPFTFSNIRRGERPQSPVYCRHGWFTQATYPATPSANELSTSIDRR